RVRDLVRVRRPAGGDGGGAALAGLAHGDARRVVVGERGAGGERDTDDQARRRSGDDLAHEVFSSRRGYVKARPPPPLEAAAGSLSWQPGRHALWQRRPGPLARGPTGAGMLSRSPGSPPELTREVIRSCYVHPAHYVNGGCRGTVGGETMAVADLGEVTMTYMSAAQIAADLIDRIRRGEFASDTRLDFT